MVDGECLEFKHRDVLTRHSGSTGAPSSRTVFMEENRKNSNIVCRDRKTNRKARIKVMTNQNERKCIKIMSLFT
jgi:hypothetical protein